MQPDRRKFLKNIFFFLFIILVFSLFVIFDEETEVELELNYPVVEDTEDLENISKDIFTNLFENHSRLVREGKSEREIEKDLRSLLEKVIIKDHNLSDRQKDSLIKLVINKGEKKEIGCSDNRQFLRLKVVHLG